MLRVLFTLDYEIHGNGEGCPWSLMVEPTRHMLDLFDRYGAKLTILADVAEILKFREHQLQTGRDDFHYEAIARQLQDAVARGHDVQLHLHASYFNARFENGAWQQDWSEYNFAGLPYERMTEIVRTGKNWLEKLLKPVQPDYACTVFRAANWSVNPSRNVACALRENGIRIDTSIFRYGKRQGLVNFDYTQAWSNLLPWPVDPEDFCARNNDSGLFEFPIYSEQRWIGAFLTPQRIYRAMQSRKHKFHIPADNRIAPARSRSGNRIKRLVRALVPGNRHAWKADFNQCTGRQLIGALRRAESAHHSNGVPQPFVLIGHSKLFTGFNERSLKPFLGYVAERPNRFAFGKYGDFDLEQLRDHSGTEMSVAGEGRG